MSKNILITGCAGMIGSNLVHYLLANTDWHIIGIDNLSGGYADNLPLEHERFGFHVAEANSKVTDRLFEIYDFDVVYHAAAYAAEGLSPFIRKFNYINNVVETAAIVNKCIECGSTLIFFSSIAVYGRGHPPFREIQKPHPIDPYGIAKYACEMDIQVAADQHDLLYTIVRPFNLYGEHQNIWDRYRNVFGIWMYNKLNGLPITIYGDGSQMRSFTYVGDIMHALHTFGEELSPYRIYNLGTCIGEHNVSEAAQVFQEIVGGCNIQYLPERHEVQVAWPDVTRCASLIPNTTSLREGLSRMWDWAKQQPVRRRAEAPPYEITKGMYEHWK